MPAVSGRSAQAESSEPVPIRQLLEIKREKENEKCQTLMQNNCAVN